MTGERESAALLPCPNPWCDGTHQFVQHYHRLIGDCAVTCGCGFMGPLKANEAEAIAAWNTRPDADREREAMREALEAEDDYWAASRALASAFARIRPQAQAVFDAASRRRADARAALPITKGPQG